MFQRQCSLENRDCADRWLGEEEEGCRKGSVWGHREQVWVFSGRAGPSRGTGLAPEPEGTAQGNLSPTSADPAKINRWFSLFVYSSSQGQCLSSFWSWQVAVGKHSRIFMCLLKQVRAVGESTLRQGEMLSPPAPQVWWWVPGMFSHTWANAVSLHYSDQICSKC